MEIAKLRASRALWAKILKHFGVQDDKLTPMRTHVRTSWRYQSTYDPWVNMLRGTVESMAAALGGANAIRTAPFDETVGEASEFSKRVSRNIQLVLQEEAHLGQIADPAAGSYYVEQLTGSIAQHAWTMFRSIEKNGGFFAELVSGSIQDGIAATAEKKRKNLALRRDILIGTNQYPNPTEQPLADVSTNEETVHRLQALAVRSYSERSSVPLCLEGNTFEAMQRAFMAGATLRDVLEALGTDSSTEKISPIPQYRAAAGFEKLRQAVAASTRKPVVFLAPLGPVFWRKARATFASGFFGTAGLRVVDNSGFESAESAVNAALKAGTDILVVCSDDDSYPIMVPEILERVRQADSAMQVVVAGYPKDSIQQLENAGVAQFIHVKADVEATLASMFRTFGLQVD